ncbi:MAG: ABC transporter ATP-binding protein [Candidatus Diapherotrites archaeon]|nr:ABC transporter ATP-binding protein [Candidatus Diapherotrites archaeon]
MVLLSIKNVSKIYGQKKVLDNISFDILEGEIFGLLGSNGAGKSTLMSIILGLNEPDSGEISVFGSAKIHDSIKKISLVPQDPAFYADFSVEKNMHFFGSINGLGGAVLEDRINFLLKWLELEEFRETTADFLSGGYQRLLNIALSLIHDPLLIFMDEPTAGLDPKMRQMFWSKIRELKKSGKTVIITTHYMDEAEALCTRIALLKKGALLSIGTPEELIRQYGGIKVVIFKMEKNVSQADIESIKKALKQESVIERGNLLIIPLQQAHSVEKIAAITQWLIDKGYNILSAMTKEPDLEDVFLNITGEKMVV